MHINVLSIATQKIGGYCKTLLFRCILVSRFPYVENSLHFNFADFPVNFIMQFVSRFYCRPTY